jgi:hypothetical protein
MMVFQKRGYEQGIPKEVVKRMESKWRCRKAQKFTSSRKTADRGQEIYKRTPETYDEAYNQTTGKRSLLI